MRVDKITITKLHTGLFSFRVVGVFDTEHREFLTEEELPRAVRKWASSPTWETKDASP